MFDELSKLLDRNFAIGFVLPVAVWLIISGLMLRRLHPLLLPEILAGSDPLITTVFFGFIAWAGGVVLKAINPGLFRLLQGYGGRLNPFHYLSGFEIRRYNALKTKVESLQLARNSLPGKSKARERIAKEYRLAFFRLAHHFPDAKEHVLPTPFGNVVRAFSVYPRVMYGFEGVQGWNRLLTVVPKDYRELVEQAKSTVDMWVNFWWLCIILMIEAIISRYLVTDNIFALIALVSVGFALMATQRAQSAAIAWGEYFKAAFDVFMPDLTKKMGYTPPSGRVEARDFWMRYSQAIVFNLPDRLPEERQASSQDNQNDSGNTSH